MRRGHQASRSQASQLRSHGRRRSGQRRRACRRLRWEGQRRHHRGRTPQRGRGQRRNQCSLPASIHHRDPHTNDRTESSAGQQRRQSCAGWRRSGSFDHRVYHRQSMSQRMPFRRQDSAEGKPSGRETRFQRNRLQPCDRRKGQSTRRQPRDHRKHSEGQPFEAFRSFEQFGPCT
eukprot:28533_1